MTCKTAIVGNGALGTVLYRMMAACGGADVHLLGRRPKADEHPQPLDCVLICTKSFDTDAALERVAPWIGPGTLIATLQNGAGNLERIVERFGADRALAGSTTHAARREADGRIVHTARGRTALAALSARGRERLQALVPRLRALGLEVTLETEPEALIWHKLVLASALLPVTALLEIPNGQIARPGAARELALGAVREAERVALVSGKMEPFDAEARLLDLARTTARNRSSMLSDLAAGRRTEIDQINGAIVRTACAHGLQATIHQTLWSLVRGREEALGVHAEQGTTSERRNEEAKR